MSTTVRYHLVSNGEMCALSQAIAALCTVARFSTSTLLVDDSSPESSHITDDQANHSKEFLTHRQIYGVGMT